MTASSWELEPGAAIAGGRTVLERLGGGSRYEVHLVWDDRLYALMVAKLLRPDQVDDERALRELEREAQILDRLAHPVLVRGFDAVLDGPHPHLLIEHLEGPTLRSLIRRAGPLGLQQLLPLAMHVAAALHYLGGEEVVHLDVKPDNIVMGVPPRLIDLSVARPVEQAAHITGQVGTDAYMAPEQCDPGAFPGAIGPPTDVWGLAATLHHAASGSRPFPRAKEGLGGQGHGGQGRGAGVRGDDLDLRFPQLVAEPQPLPPSTPGELADVLGAALRKDPSERPAAAELVMALEPLVAALPSRMVLGRRGARGA